MKPVPPPVLITITGITMAGWFLARPGADSSASGSPTSRGQQAPTRSLQPGPRIFAPAAAARSAGSPDVPGTPPPVASPATRPAQAGPIRSIVRAGPALSLPPPPAQLRTYVPVSRGRMAGGTPSDHSAAAGLTLDLGWESVLPAVMAAPAASSAAENPTPASASAGTILEEFVAAVSPPAGAPLAGPVAPDQVWQDSVRLADERFRAIFGREAFLRQSLQAARVLREAPSVP